MPHNKPHKYNNKIILNKKGMTTSKIDLRTPLQKERDERNQKIFKEYIEMKEMLPKDTSKLSIWRVIAEKYNMQPQGIRTIILKMEKQKRQEDETTN